MTSYGAFPPRWAVVLGVLIAVSHIAAAVSPPGSSQAYVTLLYGESYFLGVRVLGQSLRESGTSRYQSLEPRSRCCVLDVHT